MLQVLFLRTSWEPWLDGVTVNRMWSQPLREGTLALKEGFIGSHEGVSEDPKVGAIAEFFGESVSKVDFSRNVFDPN